MSTTAEDVLEGLERLLAAVDLDGPAPAAVFRGHDEAGAAQRDADRVFTVLPVSDKRTDKRSGGSCYRRLIVQIGVQYHRSKLTRRRMLADALVFEDALRHARAGLAALAAPVTIHEERILDGPRFDLTGALDAMKTLTIFSLEVEYTTDTG